MSIRSAKRQIAKARMAALGVDRVNRKMGPTIRYTRAKIRRWMRTRSGRKDKLNAGLETAIWRRVLTGDLSADAEKAQIGKKKKQNDSSGRVARRIRRAGGIS